MSDCYILSRKNKVRAAEMYHQRFPETYLITDFIYALFFTF